MSTNSAVRFILIGVSAVALLGFVGCHSTTVEPGSVGVKFRAFPTGGAPGVAADALATGWHLRMPGERIFQYPVIERQYSYTRETNGDGGENEELVFVDKNGLEIKGDINIGVRVLPTAAPSVYTKYRANLDYLLENQIRNAVRTAVARSAATMPVESMLGGGYQKIARDAFSEVSNRWRGDGIEITRLEWSGAPRFPEVVTTSILARARADQDVQKANAEAAVAEAEKRRKVAEAEGDAQALTIRGQALRANPQIMQQQAIAKWDGVLPRVTSGAVPFIKID
ncbi:SPFH domain-containing protein [Caulobacter sp. Root343]|uniref:SPFH domain-containing protein n=1 Tax=Caulobacter sp. Root343 TaxID=1736520 RepID=UPI0006FF88DD|nr:SPFH domain-containing protein [Caulobacter sp. Root343]KQV66595.1 hypothetical protein ASC70_12235 [Caulobacter sp. Root343]